MMADVFEGLYKSIKTVFTGDSALADLVPVANMKPSNDPLPAVPGNLLTYGWVQSAWNRKARRGQGLLTIVASGEESKSPALQILARLRDLMTERTLSRAAGSVVTVHLCREQETTTDESLDGTGRFAVAAQFEIKLIEKPA
jgi:hypothetical protein